MFQVFSLRAAPGRNSTPTIRGTRVSTVRRSTALRCETSKYWAVCGGFVKYHHPAFSDDRYDLDFELFELLPLVADTAPAARNEILAQWIDGFGQYKTAPGKYEKILTSDSVFEHRTDIGWIRDTATRSEERRVGKECRSRWSPYH